MTAEFGHHYIAGQWVSDAPNGLAEVENPSDGSVIGTAPNGSVELADRAVLAAREAFETTGRPDRRADGAGEWQGSGAGAA